MPVNHSNFQAFTVKSHKGKINFLTTPCGASIAFLNKKGLKIPIIVNVTGLWDTGATGSVITSKLVAELDLKPFTKTNVSHAAGTSEGVPVYKINVYLPNGVGVQMVNVTLGELPPKMDMLIGMDIITTGDFAITNKGGNYFFFQGSQL